MLEGLKRFWDKLIGRKTETIYKRRFEGARLNRLTNDWLTATTNANQILRMDLNQLRRRSQDLAKNDPYAKRFFQLCRTNIVGRGMNLQVHTAGENKARDQKLTSKIESKFYEWGNRKTCTASQKLNWVQAQQLFVTQLSRDGEALVRFIKDDANPFGFSLRFYSADWLDEMYSEELRGGNRVIMSVEFDRNDKAVAYWLTEPVGNYPMKTRSNRQRVRVPAEEMIHSFVVTEGEDQARGYPWIHSSMLRLFMLYGFEEAELEQKRVAACQGSYLIPPPDLDVNQFQGDETDEATTLEDVEPGMQQILKPGWDVKEFSPKVDNSIEGFRKSALRGAAAGMGISYHTVAGDLESVNYSSARIGSLDDRDFWREMQDFVISSFCDVVYQKWLNLAFLKGALEITFADFMRVQTPTFRARGWAWVDPGKDMKANIDGLGANLTTRTQILAEQGIDIEDHFATIQKEKDLAKKYGIDLDLEPKKEDKPDDNADDKPEAKPKQKAKV